MSELCPECGSRETVPHGPGDADELLVRCVSCKAETPFPPHAWDGDMETGGDPKRPRYRCRRCDTRKRHGDPMPYPRTHDPDGRLGT